MPIKIEGDSGGPDKILTWNKFSIKTINGSTPPLMNITISTSVADTVEATVECYDTDEAGESIFSPDKPEFIDLEQNSVEIYSQHFQNPGQSRPSTRTYRFLVQKLTLVGVRYPDDQTTTNASPDGKVFTLYIGKK